MRRVVRFVLGWLAFVAAVRADEAVWQWSAPTRQGRAFLWIPEDCGHVRAVLLAQHNLIERAILEHPALRRMLAELGMAEVFLVPGVDAVFRFDEGAGETFDGILRALADESGYTEIATAPVAPMGHSAHASFPWNFAAWNPGRTLAALSIKGDAPLTELTGSGRPNPEWGARTLDGVPGLMVMSEQEWWDARLTPLLRYRAAHPAAPLALFADVGRGHFDASDALVEFLARFLRKAAAARLPVGGAAELRAVDPKEGWLVDRWRGDEPARAPAAPFADYAGERAEAGWCFDEEMARATETIYATSRGKRKQQVGFVQDGALCPLTNSHAGIELKFAPDADGLTFRLGGEFIVPLPPSPPLATKDRRPPVVTTTPARAGGDAHATGAVGVTVLVGPVAAVAPGGFRVAPDRLFVAGDPRSREAWLLASSPGDAQFKGAVQQARLRIPQFTDGAVQTITFPAIANQRREARGVALAATSDHGLPVGYFVREGPAFVRDGTLHFTPLPPRAKRPARITVVAWQIGRGAAPMVRAAPPVERSFRWDAE